MNPSPETNESPAADSAYCEPLPLLLLSLVRPLPLHSCFAFRAVAAHAAAGACLVRVLRLPSATEALAIARLLARLLSSLVAGARRDV